MSYQLLIGSQAAKHWFSDHFDREPKDIDFFSPWEIEGAETFWHPLLSEYIPSGRVATPSELYTIKISHSFWELKNSSWEKHIHDAMWLKSWIGVELIPEFYALLYHIWTEVHGAKKVKFDDNAADFFTGQVNRKYDHDSLHASVAYYGEPLFNSILKDGSATAFDKDKWQMLSYDTKIALAREEAYVIALERRLIPNDFRGSPRNAYHWAMKKIITGLSKGEFALFCATNWNVLRVPDIDFVKRHKDNQDKLILLED